MEGKKDLPGCSKITPPPPGPKHYALSSKVGSAISKIAGWAIEEKLELASEVIKTFRGDALKLKKLMNLARDLMGQAKKGQPLSEKGKEVCGQQRNVDPGASLLPLPAPEAAVASKVPMICRGDLIVNADVIFFDTEKVTMAGSHENVSGDLAIVDIKGRLLFWTFIKQTNVCKFNTQLTGLDSKKMELGVSMESVKEILNLILQGKEIWGASTALDVKSLGFTKESDNWIFPTSAKTKDIQDFFKDYKNQSISLGLLSEHFLGENLQGKTHSSITDARLTALCYRKMKQFQALGMTRFSCPVMDELRSMPKTKDKGNIRFDKCTCGQTKIKQKNKKTHTQSMQYLISTPGKFDFDDFL